MCGKCFIGLVFVILEISIILGEALGWNNYNSNLDSFLFIIFLVLIIYYNKKNQNKKIEVKKFE